MRRLLFVGLLVVALSFAACKRTSAPEAPSTTAAAPFELTPPAKYVKDIVKSEAFATAFSKHIKSTVLKGVRGRDWPLVTSGFTADFSAHLSTTDDAPPSDDANVDLRRLPPPKRVMDRADFVAHLAATVGQWASPDRVAWKLYSSLTDEGGKRAYTEGHLYLAGVTAAGRRVEWAGNAIAELVLIGEGWQIKRLRIEDATWSDSGLEPFRDIAAVTGLRMHESEESVQGAQDLVDLRQMTQSGGLTVLDFDHDGFWDVLATRKGRGVRLFLNDGKGGFTSTVLPAIADDTEAARFYLWLDLDEDGSEELVSTRVEARGKGKSALVMYRWANGKMRAVKDALVFEHPDWMREIDFEGMTACDVNDDQRLDILMFGHSHWDSLREKFNLVDGHDGLRNFLFINQGGLKFSEEGLQRGLDATQYTFVADCSDFDGDGDVDIFAGNDYGKNNFYNNRGDGRFVEDPNHQFAQAHGFSMGLSRADYDNTGRYSVSISNMYSHAGNRILPLVEDLSDQMSRVVKAFGAGNALYEFRDGAWVDTAQDRGVALAEWAWANGFFDVDNDGDKELYVVNGFTTHTDADAPDW